MSRVLLTLGAGARVYYLACIDVSTATAMELELDVAASRCLLGTPTTVVRASTSSFPVVVCDDNSAAAAEALPVKPSLAALSLLLARIPSSSASAARHSFQRGRHHRLGQDPSPKPRRRWRGSWPGPAAGHPARPGLQVGGPAPDLERRPPPPEGHTCRR